MGEIRAWQFVDSDILLYAHDNSAGPKHARSRELLRQLWQSGDGCVSTQVLEEFALQATRCVARPLEPSVAAQILSDLAVWQVHRPSAGNLADALRLAEAQAMSFWDALVITSAVQLGCETLWSERLPAGRRFGPVVLRCPF